MMLCDEKAVKILHVSGNRVCAYRNVVHIELLRIHLGAVQHRVVDRDDNLVASFSSISSREEDFAVVLIDSLTKQLAWSWACLGTFLSIFSAP